MKNALKIFINTLNELGCHGTPFLFMIDFEMEKPIVWQISEIDSMEIKYDFQGFTNSVRQTEEPLSEIKIFANSFESYQRKFNYVFDQLNYGYSFLTNLTDRTRIEIETPLSSLFHQSKARYRLLYRDEFLVFSPEIFIQIKDNRIFSFPMKGTIDANVPNAREKILNDPKELAEHVTIVDLVRNDMSHVASNVKVERFRYIEEIKTKEKSLLQISSEIAGDLPTDYAAMIGDVLIAMLPAGSVSGAPKAKTLQIISKAEGEKRGYYTGVFGYFDGENLDSGVMIRFIEKKGDQFFYRSGGGITTQSNARLEYQELIDKIYVPID